MNTNSSFDFLYRSRRDRTAMNGFLLLLAIVWSIPLIAAVVRGFAFNGWQNFYDVIFGDIGGISLFRTYFNSFVIALLHAFFVVWVCSLAAYGFAFFEFRFKSFAYFMVLVFLAVPATSILIPLFYITKELGLRDNYLAVALPEAALTLPFGVLLLRNFSENIHKDLIEAAIVDGASHKRVFVKIFLPLCKPALLNVAALSMMWSMQDFLFPSLLFSSSEMTTAAQAVLRFKEYLGATPLDVGRYNASLVLLAVPALFIVLFGLRYITGGLTAGGVKE
jgi:raffinose/stachyose/melibiose transport system permease protein